MIYVFLAEGFEEIEALATVDVLRRGELDVCTVGMGGKQVTGAHGITVEADIQKLCRKLKPPSNMWRKRIFSSLSVRRLTYILRRGCFDFSYLRRNKYW